MNKIVNISIIVSLIGLVLTSCSAERGRTVEARKSSPQTIIATQIGKNTVVYTQEPNSSWEFNPDYYAGIVTITEYYTYLGHGLYEEAYQLLSLDAKRPESLDEYMEGADHFFKKVVIQAIHPFDYWLILQNKTPWPSPTNELRFVVYITAWGQGTMSGSVPSGQPQTLFISLVKENGEWKIDKFATAPWRRR